MPRHICKHPLFGDLISQYAEDLNLLESPKHMQLPMLKTIILETSRAVRDHLLTHDAQGVESQRMVVVCRPSGMAARP